MSRVTIEMRSDIVTKAVAAKFTPRQKALEAAMTALADSLWKTAFGATEALARQLPPGWVLFTDSISIKMSGFESSHYIDFYHERAKGPCKHLKTSKEYPMPNDRDIEVGKEHPCYEQAKAIVKEWHAIRNGKDELSEKLRALLFSVTTTKQLREAWPEGEPFFPKEMKHSTALVPITLTHEINQMLGLKSKAPPANQAIVKAAVKKAKAKA